MSTTKADFFISYTGTDKQWAEWVAWQLEEAGYSTVLQAWDFRPGTNFVRQMQTAMERAARTVAILSDTYLNALFTHSEWQDAFRRDPTGEHALLVPIRVSDCALSGILAQTIYIDFVGLDEGACQAALLAGIDDGRAKPLTPPRFPVKEPFPGKSTPVEPKTGPPALPEPYFFHPYFTQSHFTGRARERARLTQWLKSEEHPILMLSAIGGMGKSALTWEWVNRDVLVTSVAKTDEPINGIFWWCFYESEASFANFVREALRYFSNGKITKKQLRKLSVGERVQELASLIRRYRFLVVLDGFERELFAYASTSAAYISDDDVNEAEGDVLECIDPNAASFLRKIAASGCKSKVLLTTRLLPRGLDGSDGCIVDRLTGMEDDDVASFFKANEIKGTRVEFIEAAAPYGNHALAVRLLAGVVLKDKSDPGEIAVASRYPLLPSLKGRSHNHILQVAFNSMSDTERALLCKIAAYRTPMRYRMLEIFNEAGDRQTFDNLLQELIDRGLLFHDTVKNVFDLHPIVRQYAYDRLTNKEAVAQQVRGYFEAAPLPGDDEVLELDDLSNVFELFHHTVRAGYIEDAYRLYRDRLEKWIRKFGAYTRAIELLLDLCPQGPTWPEVTSRHEKARIIGALAEASEKSGKAMDAIGLHKANCDLARSIGDHEGVALGLLGQGRQLVQLGRLKEARRVLGESLREAKLVSNEGTVGIVHLELGTLDSLRGNQNSAEKNFEATDAIAASPLVKCRSLLARGQHAVLHMKANEAVNITRNAYLTAKDLDRQEELMLAELLLSRALLRSSYGKQELKSRLAEVQGYIDSSLTRCRRANIASSEPSILLVSGALSFKTEDLKDAATAAAEALELARRFKYRLIESDAMRLLGEIAFASEEDKAAAEHARASANASECDGGADTYAYGITCAQDLLRRVAERRSRGTRKTKAKTAKESKRSRRRKR